MLGFMVRGKLLVKDVGVQIDINTETPSGAKVWFECKGSALGERPGLKRTDSVKKAVADAFLVQPLGVPYVILTSHLPDRGTNGWNMLHAAIARGACIVVCVNEPAHIKWLKAWMERPTMPVAS